MSNQSVQHRLQRLATRVARRLRQNRNPLSAAQQSVLESLTESGPMTVGELARCDGVSAPTVSRIIDALEARNLVRRARDKRDRRIVYAIATREGQGLLESARHDPRRLGDLLAGLEPEQIRALDRKLREIEEILFS